MTSIDSRSRSLSMFCGAVGPSFSKYATNCSLLATTKSVASLHDITNCKAWTMTTQSMSGNNNPALDRPQAHHWEPQGRSEDTMSCQGPLKYQRPLLVYGLCSHFGKPLPLGLFRLYKGTIAMKSLTCVLCPMALRVGNAPHVGGAEGRCHSLPDLPPVTVCWACQDAWTTQQLQNASTSMTLSLLKQAKQSTCR